MQENEACPWPGQGGLRHVLGDEPELGRVRAEELAPSGQVVKEFPDLDRRPPRQGDVGDGSELLALALDHRAAVPGAVMRPQGQFRNGGDAGQGLAAEAEGGDPLEVVLARNLARRVPPEAQGRVLAAHARAIVLDLDQPLPAFDEFDPDVGGSGVEGILDEFLDHGYGPLDDLPGGDLLGDLGRQNVDLIHDTPTVPSMLCGRTRTTRTSTISRSGAGQEGTRTLK